MLPLPQSLQALSDHVRLGPDVPCLVVRPEGEPLGGSDRPVPFLFWMHGRTATKELDPGRYLRLARAGIGSCAVDLPGHGERGSEAGMRPEAVLDNIEQAASKVRLPRRRAAVTSRAVVGATAVAVFRKLCDKARRTCACLVV